MSDGRNGIKELRHVIPTMGFHFVYEGITPLNKQYFLGETTFNPLDDNHICNVPPNFKKLQCEELFYQPISVTPYH